MRKTIHKPWGKEEWLELNDKYCYKRIYINAGYKTSFQYHQFKKETNYIISGEAEIWLENNNGEIEKKLMKAGDYFTVSPPKKHRVVAITDIILQEVSTPEVDDVFRIDDEFNRADGKIDAEHKTPAVLILAAGIGSRLGNLTKNVNKAMLPINNKAIISYIIEKFPSDYEFIITLGYKGELLKEYCLLAHPNHNFTFVTIDNFDNEGSGPGYSTMKCKEYLQRPFYFVVGDCIIDSELPHLDGNWLGVYPTAYPEKYSTIYTDDKDNILHFTNKNFEGYENAFIGLAGILNYEVFWDELENNMEDGELVSAFEKTSKYPNFKAKHLKWLDTGNLDDLNKTKEYFKDNPLSLFKLNDEITYNVNNKFIKFNPDEELIQNKRKRSIILNNLIPSGYNSSKYISSYDYQPGHTLYEYNSLELYLKFLTFFKHVISISDKWVEDPKTGRQFYFDKTEIRKQKFIDRFGLKYYTESFNINGEKYDSLKKILDKLYLTESWPSLFNVTFYSLFHGDLQFDNILYNEKDEKFTYIDWRDSFANDVNGGDLYYDLAKLYGGCLINYNKMKTNCYFELNEVSNNIIYQIKWSTYLDMFKGEYEKWLIKEGFDLDKIKLITAIIFLNMSPLHDEKSGKMLWFKAIELLTDVNK